MMVSLLRYANGHAWRPVFLDEIGVANGDFSVGLMHSGNMRRPADPTDVVDTSVRWKLMASRFSSESYPPAEVPFAWDAASALPKVCTAFFDREMVQWQPPLRLGERVCSTSREPLEAGARAGIEVGPVPKWDAIMHTFLELQHYDSAWCALGTWQRACSGHVPCSSNEWDRIAFFSSVLQSLAKKDVWAGAARSVERWSNKNAFSTTHTIRTHRLTRGCALPVRADGATLVESIRKSLQRAAYDEAEACAWRILLHSGLELRHEMLSSVRSLTNAIGGRAGFRAQLGRWPVMPAPVREPEDASELDDSGHILELGSSALLFAYAVSLQWCNRFLDKSMRQFANGPLARTSKGEGVTWHFDMFPPVNSEAPLDGVHSAGEGFEAETWTLFQVLVRWLKAAQNSPLIHNGSENRLFVHSVRLSRLQLQDSGQGGVALSLPTLNSVFVEVCVLLFLNSGPHGLVVECDDGMIDERSLAGRMLLLPCSLAATGRVRLRGHLPLWLLIVVLSHQSPVTASDAHQNI